MKYKLQKNYDVLVYDKKVPRHVQRIAIVTDSNLVKIVKQKEAIVRIKKANAIFKRPVNKLYPTEYIYHDTNQTDKEREQKLGQESAIIDELKRNMAVNYVNIERERGGVFEYCKYQCFSQI